METRAECPLRVRVNWMLEILIGPVRFVSFSNERAPVCFSVLRADSMKLPYARLQVCENTCATSCVWQVWKKVIKTSERCYTTYVRYCKKEEFYQLIFVQLCLRKMLSRQFWLIIFFRSLRSFVWNRLKQLFDVHCKILLYYYTPK